MSGIEETFRRIVPFLEEKKIDYMLIGGYALPYYGRVRVTLDIDIAVAIQGEEDFQTFCEDAKKEGYSVYLGSYENPVCLFHDRVTDYEVEVWSKLDGVEWSRETLKRRREVRIAGIEIWIISPEDFIVSKLARPDRGVSDEQDVKSVLERDDVELDWRYLEERAERTGVLALLETIRNM
ncbi:MAG: nucleotidyltransferase family protein [Candidatus Bathyarchaeota archaeon]|nr:nucleotidyltransferase family protein [Candidatus Bathyarchaeota archaeon]